MIALLTPTDRPPRLLRLAALLALGLPACTPAPSTSTTATAGATFVVVRHAEKATDDKRDPNLSPEGQARARALAERLKGVRLVAAYGTKYKRTHQTAAPTAQQHGVTVQTYDVDEAAPALVARLQKQHPDGVVLVVGHSPTVPEIVGALCRCKVAAIDESDYGNLYEVQTGGGGQPVLKAQRFP